MATTDAKTADATGAVGERRKRNSTDALKKMMDTLMEEWSSHNSGRAHRTIRHGWVDHGGIKAIQESVQREYNIDREKITIIRVKGTQAGIGREKKVAIITYRIVNRLVLVLGRRGMN